MRRSYNLSSQWTAFGCGCTTTLSVYFLKLQLTAPGRFPIFKPPHRKTATAGKAVARQKIHEQLERVDCCKP